MKPTKRSSWGFWAIFMLFTILIRLMAHDSGKAQSKPRAKSTPARGTQSIAPVAEQAQVAVAAPVESAPPAAPTSSHSPSPKGSRRGFVSITVGTTMAFVVSLMMAGTALAAPPAPTCADTDPDCQDIVEFVNGSQNAAAYWDLYFDVNGHPDYVCTKIDQQPFPVVLAENHDALVIKTGQWFYIWVPAPAGNYSAAQDSTSHYYTCDGDEIVEDQVIDPHGSIGGPCADPAYYGIFDNTLSTVSIRFRFTWYTTLGHNKIVKMVPGGLTYTTVQRWAKPGTPVRVGYQDPVTFVWNSLDSLVAEHGSNPPCDVVPGWSGAV